MNNENGIDKIIHIFINQDNLNHTDHHVSTVRIRK